MILINTFLDKSDIHGIGLFTSNNIKKGDVIYAQSKKLDILMSINQFKLLSHLEQRVVSHYGFLKENNYHLAFDDIRFLNHSITSNVVKLENKLIAKHDIMAGEELLQDYREFEELREELKLHIFKP